MWIQVISVAFLSLLLFGQSSSTPLGCEEKETFLANLEMATSAISTANSLSEICSTATTFDTTTCGRKKLSAYLDMAVNLMSKAELIYLTCSAVDVVSQKPGKNLHPADCSEVLENGGSTSGIYTIYPRNRVMIKKGGSVKVYCDMTTNGGGWTVIQRRGNYKEQENFDQDWETYKTGFGNIEKDFWLGNDNIFALTNQKDYVLRFDIENHEGEHGYAEYSPVWIDNESANYTLHYDNFVGNVGDGLTGSDNNIFLTKDRQKNGIQNCAISAQGGWWYDNHSCGLANPNGLYQPDVLSDQSNVHWYHWNKYRNLKGIEMKLRPI